MTLQLVGIWIIEYRFMKWLVFLSHPTVGSDAGWVGMTRVNYAPATRVGPRHAFEDSR